MLSTIGGGSELCTHFEERKTIKMLLGRYLRSRLPTVSRKEAGELVSEGYPSCTFVSFVVQALRSPQIEIPVLCLYAASQFGHGGNDLPPGLEADAMSPRCGSRDSQDEPL